MGWSNTQATTLDGQAVTYTNSTTTYSTGSVLAVAANATFTVNGLSPALGIVARNFSGSDLPSTGTAADAPGTAATVLTTTLAVAVKDRMYLITSPGLSARMNIANGSTGFQYTYTEDGTTPTTSSPQLGVQQVFCPNAGFMFASAMGFSYTRRLASGPLRVLLSVWNVSAGTATVANGLGGGKIELLVIDQGIDPGVTS